MAPEDACCEPVLICRDCGMRFERGIADTTREGRERCPQCGLDDIAEAPETSEETFVVRQGTRFR